MAQAFRTGADGPTLSEVQLKVCNTISGTAATIRVKENNSSNQPGDLVATLTSPDSLSLGFNSFTAPAQ